MIFLLSLQKLFEFLILFDQLNVAEAIHIVLFLYCLGLRISMRVKWMLFFADHLSQFQSRIVLPQQVVLVRDDLYLNFFHVDFALEIASLFPEDRYLFRDQR